MAPDRLLFEGVAYGVLPGRPVQVEAQISSVRALYRPLYAVGEAARLLEPSSQKLKRWLDGFEVSGRQYPPVIRPYPTGSDEVTWAEFVEAGFLREYRAREVSLQRLRPLIDGLREKYQVPYPLAQFKPLVDPLSRELVFELQRVVGLDEELFLVRPIARDVSHLQLQWADPVVSFLEKVEFDPEGIAERMRPLGGSSPVVIDPEMAFGIPQIRGIRTETIAEAVASGEDEARVAKSWGLSGTEVQAALDWEKRLGRVA